MEKVHKAVEFRCQTPSPKAHRKVDGKLSFKVIRPNEVPHLSHLQPFGTTGNRFPSASVELVSISCDKTGAWRGG